MAEPALNLPGPDEAPHSSPGGAQVIRAGEFHPTDKACFICGGSADELAEIFGKWMCRDRVPCYQRWVAGKR